LIVDGMRLDVIKGEDPAAIVTYDKLDFRLGVDNQLAEVFTLTSRAGNRKAPSISGVSFNEIARRAPDVLPYIHILNVSDQPATFEFERFGFGTTVTGGFQPKYFGETVPLFGPKLWSSLASLYADAAFRSRVSLSEVHARSFGQWYAYRRLIMPLSTNGREIDQVLCAVVHKTVEFQGLLPGDLGGVDVDKIDPVSLSSETEIT
tara:strand:- start:8225 stop:8839 length:615 start_codon:yes stop_codon:yes gene_type:complete